MIVWLKVLHVASIAIWCGTLFGFPLLLPAKTAGLPEKEILRLQHILRFAYVHIASPAAFMAIASGVTLVLVAEILTPWMAVKLAFVGILVILHMRAGHHIVHLFRTEAVYRLWQAAFATGATGITVLSILWLVLNKPGIALHTFPAWLRTPGSLQSLVEIVVPIP